LSLAYGWTPQQIARMTIGQVWIYLNEAVGPGQRQRTSPSDARMLCRRVAERRNGWIRRTMEETNRAQSCRTTTG